MARALPHLLPSLSHELTDMSFPAHSPQVKAGLEHKDSNPSNQQHLGSARKRLEQGRVSGPLNARNKPALPCDELISSSMQICGKSACLFLFFLFFYFKTDPLLARLHQP